jgi:pyrroline-5-carboxylate reductase
MTTPTIGFLGGGRIARIFLDGWKRAGSLPASITVCDAHPQAQSDMRARFPGVQVTGDPARAAAADVVFVALPVPSVVDVLTRVKSVVRAQAIVVSLAPKITTAALSGALGGLTRLVRVIPNAPSIIGAGFNPVAFAPGLPADAKALVLRLLAPLGESPEVAEHKLEAYAVISAMGPTYFWYQLNALREQAATFGLTPAESGHALERMLTGAAKTLFDSGLSPTEVLSLVPSKPLADVEPQVLSMIRSRLPETYQKLRPS